MGKIKFSILGGDYRYKILKGLLKDDGYDVASYGSDFISDNEETTELFLKNSDVLIAPIPIAKDNTNIQLANDEQLSLSELFSRMYKSGTMVLIGGVVKDEVKKRAEKFSIKAYDFFDFEEVSVANAVPTAEGAVMTAMRESERTIFGSRALVVGFGRCGKILAKTLRGLGADTSATYRKESDRAYITAYGIKAVNASDMHCCIENYDFIFNTVPAPVIDAALLKKTDKKTIIIDIAQAPGGVDYNMARNLNIKALYCPGLPGRCAPRTAAEILKMSAINIALNCV